MCMCMCMYVLIAQLDTGYTASLRIGDRYWQIQLSASVAQGSSSSDKILQASFVCPISTVAVWIAGGLKPLKKPTYYYDTIHSTYDSNGNIVELIG